VAAVPIVQQITSELWWILASGRLSQGAHTETSLLDNLELFYPRL
jgi:hypothetical protein